MTIRDRYLPESVLKGGKIVLVTVVYKNNKMGLVDASLLDELISSRKIKTFLRSEGWVTVGVDSVRKERDSYNADPERRQSIRKS